jgi:hypothetical protein
MNVFWPKVKTHSLMWKFHMFFPVILLSVSNYPLYLCPTMVK